jgi:hypothetical protein
MEQRLQDAVQLSRVEVGHQLLCVGRQHGPDLLPWEVGLRGQLVGQGCDVRQIVGLPVVL